VNDFQKLLMAIMVVVIGGGAVGLVVSMFYIFMTFPPERPHISTITAQIQSALCLRSSWIHTKAMRWPLMTSISAM